MVYFTFEQSFLYIFNYRKLQCCGAGGAEIIWDLEPEINSFGSATLENSSFLNWIRIRIEIGAGSGSAFIKAAQSGSGKK